MSRSKINNTTGAHYSQSSAISMKLTRTTLGMTTNLPSKLLISPPYCARIRPYHHHILLLCTIALEIKSTTATMAATTTIKNTSISPLAAFMEQLLLLLSSNNDFGGAVPMGKEAETQLNESPESSSDHDEDADGDNDDDDIHHRRRPAVVGPLLSLTIVSDDCPGRGMHAAPRTNFSRWTENTHLPKSSKHAPRHPVRSSGSSGSTSRENSLFPLKNRRRLNVHFFRKFSKHYQQLSRQSRSL